MEILTTLGINPQVILANIISFLLLLWLLKKFMLAPLGSIIHDRKAEIESSYQKIAEETAKVEQAQTDLNNRLAAIEIEARSKIEEAGQQAAKLKDDILAEARAQAEQVKERGIQDIERERDKALQSIREHVANLVVQTGEKLLGEAITPGKHHELISKTLDQLESSKN